MLLYSIQQRFNRINPNRSIPTTSFDDVLRALSWLFQSYQSKQINPDLFIRHNIDSTDMGFNRINPNRSIPTGGDANVAEALGDEFQSYQSKQINPDKPVDDSKIEYQYERFQSYQSKQINPDCVQ